jgi:hypothetical protein
MCKLAEFDPKCIIPEVILPLMSIGPPFKAEPAILCRDFQRLMGLSSTSQDHVSLEASDAGEDSLLHNVCTWHIVTIIAILGLFPSQWCCGPVYM